MNDTTHTPTPWALLEGNRATTIYGPDERGALAKQIARLENEVFPREGRHDADAAFIVKACNNHQLLVEALAALYVECPADNRRQIEACENARALLAKLEA